MIDAFDYLEQWAAEGDARMSELKSIAVQLRVNRAEFYDLERKIKNLRSQLKRKGHPQPLEERQAFNSARWNPHSEAAKVLLDRLPSS